MIRDNLVLLWAGLGGGSLMCLASTKRRGFAVIAAGSAVCCASAFAGASPGAQGISFCVFIAAASVVRVLISLPARLKKTAKQKNGGDKNKFTKKTVRRP